MGEDKWRFSTNGISRSPTDFNNESSLVSNRLYFSSLDVRRDLDRLPCLSTEFCSDLPSLGDFITTTMETGGQAWQRTQASLTCQKEEHFFLLPDLNNPTSLKARCVPNILFGGHFPYWEIPGLDYPAIIQLECLNARTCRDFPELSSMMDRRGFMDNFDQVNSVVGDSFQYFCNMEGDRGGESQLQRNVLSEKYFQFTRGSPPHLTMRGPRQYSTSEPITPPWRLAG